MNALFGTDGIRGRAGEYPLDAPTVVAIGAALTRRFALLLGRTPRVVSGRDTRASGPEIESLLATGVASEGGSTISAGVLPTPAVAFLAQRFAFDFGVVVSASHNPHEDNGIKVFSHDGRKLDDRMEDAVAEDVARMRAENRYPEPTALTEDPDLEEAYRRRLVTEIGADLDLKGLRLAMDCANGAASRLAPMIFEQLGARVEVIHASPNGVNINRNCGALHLDDLVALALSGGFDLGVAFDGDADRLQLVGPRGDIYDGDYVLYAVAVDLQLRERLNCQTVVGTVMSNAGLDLALNRRGIRLLRTPVGDRFVLEKILEVGASLGGEQSGHIIFPAISLAGDGMVSLLMVLEILTGRATTLDELMGGMKRLPQILINVPVRSKPPMASIPEIEAQCRAIEARIAGRGRLLLRYSGTENIARVMIEGEDQAEIGELAKALAGTIKASLAGAD